MTINQLANKIAKAEGKKHQASVGDVREVVKLIAIEFYEAAANGKSGTLANLFIDAGYKATKKVK